MDVDHVGEFAETDAGIEPESPDLLADVHVGSTHPPGRFPSNERLRNRHRPMKADSAYLAITSRQADGLSRPAETQQC
jgi:hypothetical protein